MRETQKQRKVTALESCPSTNLYLKQHPGMLGRVGAVYTTNQTAGRGRLGRSWENAAGQALYYTVALDLTLAQPETLPQLSSLLAARLLQEYYGISCQIKWPNDLLINGKKIAGILCESIEYDRRRIWLSGIGINLAQPQAYFDAAGLPHGTSLQLAGVAAEPKKDAPALAARLTELFAAAVEDYARSGFSPLRAEYKSICVNLGREVTFPLEGGGTGTGTAVDVDDGGRLVVHTGGGAQAVFTGEVSVSGIYGSL